MGAKFDQMCFKRSNRRALAVGLFGHFRQFICNLRHPALYAFHGLLQTHQFQLRGVVAALGLPGLRPQRLNFAQTFSVGELGLAMCGFESRNVCA